MGMFCSIVRFENLHELKRLCHWGPIIALSVIAICSTMAMIDAVLWYWPLDTTGGSINFIMLINWTVMILYNYFNAMFVGPGYVPIGWKPVSFGWSSVRIDMSAVKRDPRPIVPFGLSAFAASLFALGLALGTTIAVGMLFVIQIKVILRNKTSIESWIEEKAKDRIQYYQTGETFIFPYELGSKWNNFKQVFTWSGNPEGDGLEWPVKEGCHQYSLTIEQLKQKTDKRVRSVRYQAKEDYSGACCPLTKGLRTFFTTPCTEEPRIALHKGDQILATRGLKHWMYGDKIIDSTTDDGKRIRGWFPRRCVEKCLYDGETNQPLDREKKTR
ncbi:palmitoyltransferase ZDHHC6 isoform X7 [Hemicordylus capensis]|uniref:palmitoyltransferase ZDHHC6 isoform X7 n=1 Tax=Hemicordylus capensis TaxID=884348 RepID=UPI0023034A81|nr:palmitoyltransferase ZDHHC6 isoform X7 [Hemicordylus capensis]